MRRGVECMVVDDLLFVLFVFGDGGYGCVFVGVFVLMFGVVVVLFCIGVLFGIVGVFGKLL